MKKLLALLLAAVMCFSLVACGNDNTALVEEYENKIAELEAMLAERDAEIERLLAEIESTEPENTEPENTEPENTEPQYETVEITLDNWQDYFEYTMTVSPRMNAFGEVETLCPVMRFHLKEEWVSITTDIDVVLEYNAVDTYKCMFSYNIDTGEFTVGEKIEESNSGGLWGRTAAIDGSDIEEGVSLFGTSIPGKAKITGNIAEMTDYTYATIEILRIQGTITIEA